jgi:hypothetical protein
MEIQARENDLVIATFGRGFYVLDDYTPLRNLKMDDLNKTAFISPVKDHGCLLNGYRSVSVEKDF